MPFTQVDWVGVSRAIHGHGDPATLDFISRAEYETIARQGPFTPAEPSDDDLATEKFWRDVNEMEAASAAKADELGHGSPEHDEWIRQIRQLAGHEPADPKPRRRAPAKKAAKKAAPRKTSGN
jgi:hypothetical protein